MQRHWYVKDEGVIIKNTDNEVKNHQSCILPEDGGREKTVREDEGEGELAPSIFRQTLNQWYEQHIDRTELQIECSFVLPCPVPPNLRGNLGGVVKKWDTNTKPSIETNKNWQKVTVFPAPGSSLRVREGPGSFRRTTWRRCFTGAPYVWHVRIHDFLLFILT